MKRWILYILLGLIVFFIWDNSMQNGGSSDGFSLLFAEILIDTVGIIIGILLVKLAYYIEYKISTFKN